MKKFKLFEEFPIKDLESLNTKKFEEQIKELHLNKQILTGRNIKTILEHPLVKKTLYPSRLKDIMYFTINGVKYYFRVVDFNEKTFITFVKLVPISTEEAKEAIKNTIVLLLAEL